MCWAGKLCTSGGKGGKGGTKEARTGHERAKGLQEGTRMSLRFTTYHGNGCVKCCREMGNPSFSVTSFFVMGQLVTGVSLVPDVLGHAHAPDLSHHWLSVFRSGIHHFWVQSRGVPTTVPANCFLFSMVF